MRDIIYTHAIPGVDRAYKKCQCQICGIVAICTPQFDFYCFKPDTRLICNNCHGTEITKILDKVNKKN